MRLEAVPAATVPAAWPAVAPLLARACARPGCDLPLDDLRALLFAGAASLVLIHDGDRLTAAGVTQVGRHGAGPLECWVLAVGGAMAGPWPAVIAAVEAGAAAAGCARVAFGGRRGWARLLPDYRAEPGETGLIFTKDLAR